MPTEFRFDELDLREEPAKGAAVASSADIISTHITCATIQCGGSYGCTLEYCCDTGSP
jgi:hypothetical protein